jgi:hypothetical protein
MKMNLKIAVTDACIFIDLFDIDLITSFFGLELEVHTTSGVYFELNDEQQLVLKAYQSVNKLVIHNLTENDFLEIYSEGYSKSLSETDKSVLYIANKLNACVLSSDKTVRNHAKNKFIECHGIIWVFDELVRLGILARKEAADKLNRLISLNYFFQNNKHLMSEIETRLKAWG